MKHTLIKFVILLFLTSSFNSLAKMDDVVVSAQQVSGNVYMLKGAGGNIGVLVGEDGILLVDDQFEPLGPKIEQALAGIAENKNNKVSYVVNTHYHGDHTGANVYFSKSASILAHENVRKRMSVKSKGPGLPVITYDDGIKVHINNDKVHVRHLATGHTDGDSVVLFEKHNVWHLGDQLFESRFPYIDLKSGGSVQGYIDNLATVISQLDKDSKVIPGHGVLTDIEGVKKARDMIISTREEVLTMKASGLSLEQCIEKGLDKKWLNWGWAFITEERWIKTLY